MSPHLSARSRRRPEEWPLIGLEGFVGLGAIAGCAYALGGAKGVPVEWLEGSPFEDYTGPGLILGLVMAPASVGAANAFGGVAAELSSSRSRRDSSSSAGSSPRLRSSV